MPEATQDHWEQVYADRAPQSVSWFQSEPSLSLQMIAKSGVGTEASVIDIGAGASNLADHLLDLGFHHITVLDVSATALAVAQSQLGKRAATVVWKVEDVTTWTPPPGAFDLWHDRAVFHFLVAQGERDAYLRALNRGVKSGGWVVLATFSPTGPDRCSGLPVQRYSAGALQAALGAGFTLMDTESETHVTPGGGGQDFTWCLFRKIAA